MIIIRNLTVLRRKSFVGCLAKMKVYIEDYINGEIMINDISCRKIGVLKSGEQKTFEIGEEPAKVFVIADKLSRNYCNEFYELEPGSEDICLSGRNRYNPANGNAFRFDGSASPEVVENRKKGTKKGLIILCCALVIGAIVGFSIGFGIIQPAASKEKTFTVDTMSVTLTDAFCKEDYEGYTACFDSDYVAVFALKESFTLAEGFDGYTLEQYGNLVLQNNTLATGSLKQKDGLTYFNYSFTNPDTKDVYKYFSFLYKASDAFWIVQFAIPEQNETEYTDKIFDWAKTVTFAE